MHHFRSANFSTLFYNCFYPGFLWSPLFLVPFTLISNALLRKLFLSFLNTCPYIWHYSLSPADLLFHSSPTSALDLLSTSCPLILLHTYLSPWLFQFFSKSLSHSGLGTMSHFHKALLISHSFCMQFLWFSEEISFHRVNLVILWICPSYSSSRCLAASHTPPEFILLPRYENPVTVYASSCNFSFCSTFLWCPLHFLHLIYIASLLVTRLIFAYVPCIQFPLDLHNAACTIVFLPQMPHGSFWLDGFTVAGPILLTMTFVFTRFTFRPLLLSALFQLWNISCSSAMVSTTKTIIRVQYFL